MSAQGASWNNEWKDSKSRNAKKSDINSAVNMVA